MKVLNRKINLSQKFKIAERKANAQPQHVFEIIYGYNGSKIPVKVDFNSSSELSEPTHSFMFENLNSKSFTCSGGCDYFRVSRKQNDSGIYVSTKKQRFN